ncbi:hypothetical protein Tco_0079448 [Tanacetum coccineum]
MPLAYQCSRNVPTHCMYSNLNDMVEKTMEVFMATSRSLEFSSQKLLFPFRPHASKVSKNTNLSLNWEEEPFYGPMKGIVLGHKISKKGIEVDKAKIDVIAKLPHPTTVKGIRSFLGITSSLNKDSAYGPFALKYLFAKRMPSEIAPMGSPPQEFILDTPVVADFAKLPLMGDSCEGHVDPAEKHVFKEDVNTISGTTPFWFNIVRISDSGSVPAMKL